MCTGRGYETGRGPPSQLKIGVVLKILFRMCAFNIKVAYKKMKFAFLETLM